MAVIDTKVTQLHWLMVATINQPPVSWVCSSSAAVLSNGIWSHDENKNALMVLHRFCIQRDRQATYRHSIHIYESLQCAAHEWLSKMRCSWDGPLTIDFASIMLCGVSVDHI